MRPIIEQRLFSLLRLALFDSGEDSALFEGMNDGDWQAIYDAALEQGVHAIVYDGVQRLPKELQPDIEIKVQWAYNVSHAEKFYKKQLKAAQTLTDTFKAHNIETVIMKGLSLAALYPTPSHRQFGDIDIYLRGNYEQGNKIMVESGYKVKYDFFVHSEFSVNGINIENHLYFVNPFVNKTGKKVQESLLTLAAECDKHPIVEGALIPNATFSALFFIRHSSWHFAREGIRLRDICDWALFLNKNISEDSIDAQRVIQLLQECGLERYAAILTLIARKYLGLQHSLPFAECDKELAERVKDDILGFSNPEKHKKIGFLRAFVWKIRNRRSRKWCYDLVVPDSFWGNIFYSVTNYMLHPLAVFKAKL